MLEALHKRPITAAIDHSSTSSTSWSEALYGRTRNCPVSINEANAMVYQRGSCLDISSQLLLGSF